MAENLNYDVSGSKCQDGAPANCVKYGRLYDWTTALDLPSNCKNEVCNLLNYGVLAGGSLVKEKHRGICPPNWHIPSAQDWQDLEGHIGYDIGTGTALKATSGWCNIDGSLIPGKDLYGFNALSGGLGFSGYGFGCEGYWQSTYEYNTIYAFKYHMRFNESWIGNEMITTTLDKTVGASVRCIKD
jgi:uncharacterized protein (TIGR02145 family)